MLPNILESDGIYTESLAHNLDGSGLPGRGNVISTTPHHQPQSRMIGLIISKPGSDKPNFPCNSYLLDILSDQNHYTDGGRSEQKEPKKCRLALGPTYIMMYLGASAILHIM